MPLAWRILLLALLLNVVTMGVVQFVVHHSQQRWFREQRDVLSRSVADSIAELERIYAPERLADARQVRDLILSPTVHELYDDVVVTSGRPGFEAPIYLNPRGAVHRDPDTFPRAQILEGLVRAREVEGRLPVAGGYCLAIRRDGEIAGYLWFLPKHPPALPAALPFWTSVAGVAAATVLFGLLLFVAIRRTIGVPLRTLRGAAAAVAGGAYAARVPEHLAGGELAPVVAAFNHMAAQVESHTATLERAVREAVEQAEQKERALVLSSRLASIGTLAAGVAHEINNPIGGMQNAVHRLLQTPDLPERQRTYLLLVQDGLQRIAATARRLLDFSPRQASTGLFAVGAAIERARALVEHRAQKLQVELAVAVDPGLPQVRGDAHEIQQVLLNLLLNSLDALEQQRRRGRVQVRATGEGGKVVVRVDDDGPGMDPADLGRVFDPFFSKKDRPDASGLGMFISYSIVQNHGGEITVDSRPGEGFHVRVVLPGAG
ncbi:MAG: HAMP domain-containing protein [Planctomycetes bacterium]|nr:HAMP domain-containing protein [Planctomycetota bacterium]